MVSGQTYFAAVDVAGNVLVESIDTKREFVEQVLELRRDRDRWAVKEIEIVVAGEG